MLQHSKFSQIFNIGFSKAHTSDITRITLALWPPPSWFFWATQEAEPSKSHSALSALS